MREGCPLMNGPGDFRTGKKIDQPLDLTPATEMEVIAEVATAPGADRGLGRGRCAEGGDQLGGVGDMAGVGKVEVHAAAVTRRVPFRRDPRTTAGRDG